MFWHQGGRRGFAPVAPVLGRPALGQFYPYPPMSMPAYSQELISPEHWREEKHCYRCPDGTRRFLTLVEARALGCAALPYQACRPGMGGVKMGQDLRCWKTQDGGTVCSNLMYYSPNCPDTPQVSPEPEVLPTPPEAAGAS